MPEQGSTKTKLALRRTSVPVPETTGALSRSPRYQRCCPPLLAKVGKGLLRNLLHGFPPFLPVSQNPSGTTRVSGGPLVSGAISPMSGRPAVQQHPQLLPGDQRLSLSLLRQVPVPFNHFPLSPTPLPFEGGRKKKKKKKRTKPSKAPPRAR